MSKSVPGLLLTLLFLLTFNQVSAQTFRFRNFDANMGLPQNFIYAIEQTPDGFMWIGTGEGLVRYDGLRFRSFSTRDSLADNFVMSMHVAANGTLWVGHNNGQLSYYRNQQFHTLRVENTTSPVRDLHEDAEGNIWFTVQNHGFAKVDRYNNLTTWFDSGSLGYTLFYSIYPLSDNTVLLGTSEGLMRVKAGSNGKIQGFERFDQMPMTTITAIKKRKGFGREFWIATESDGFFRFAPERDEATQIIDHSLCLSFDLQYENIQDIEEEEEGHLLLATWGQGVIKLFYDQQQQDFTESFTFSTENGMSNNFIRDLLTDKEGNYWFATYGGGLSCLTDESMIFYDLDQIGFQDNKARSVLHDGKDLWIGLENGLIRADPFCFTDFEFYDPAMGLPQDAVTGLYRDPDSTLWAATQNHGLYYKKNKEANFQPWFYTRTQPGKKINDLSGQQHLLYLATVGGYYQINLKTREQRHLTTENGLPHNNINFVYPDGNGGLWIGPKNSGICRIEDKSIEIHRITDTPTDVNDMTVDKEGRLWLATLGKGLIQYHEDSLNVLDISNGLARNFAYSIAGDSQGRLWVTHFPGLSAIEPAKDRIRIYDYEQNLGVDFHQISRDPAQDLWLASNEGVIRYRPDKDVENKVAPLLNFTSIKVSDEDFDLNKSLVLPFPYKDSYKFRFDFIGISFKNPKAVSYQYRLTRKGDKAEQEWADLGATTFREYDFLPDGDYLLEVRAANADGIYNQTPLSMGIVIAPPIWKKWWFYILLLSAMVLAVFSLIHLRERKLRKQKEALQREVDSQTVVLREQKAEIERKNRDITDSITYAKRIQSSILPPQEMLSGQFQESFIFFLPRDIVSGDFYWFHPFNGKMMICAADCTGHGVPGAFMSMIGTTLLNDIVKHNKVNSPADILHRLDLEIKTLLQKNEGHTTRDGMDISIVEIDPKKRSVRLASAKRPVFLFINGELNVYKGIRRSIGDSIMEDDSAFVNMSYQLNKNDSIYLFSDGYADQFGGPEGKKFMTANIRKLLLDIHHLPMEEQARRLRDTFIEWKGDQEQVDDVVFLGLRV